MLPTWLIEAGVYGVEADPLLAEVRRQGMAGANPARRGTLSIFESLHPTRPTTDERRRHAPRQ
jgi:hypothetical protein